METCFVIQPFDRDKYDSRYEDIFEPAIRECGIKPYRVDRDPSVNIPIEEIESGIRNARFCFAEISTNNPKCMVRTWICNCLPKGSNSSLLG